MVLRSEISFNGDVSVEPYNVICDHKTADLPPQMTNLMQLSPF